MYFIVVSVVVLCAKPAILYLLSMMSRASGTYEKRKKFDDEGEPLLGLATTKRQDILYGEDPGEWKAVSFNPTCCLFPNVFYSKTE